MRGEVGVISKGVSEGECFVVEAIFHGKEKTEEVRDLLHGRRIPHRHVQILNKGNEVLRHVLRIDVLQK